MTSPDGPGPELAVVTGVCGDVRGVAPLGLVVTGLEPAELVTAPPEPVGPDVAGGVKAAWLDDPELSVVGLLGPPLELAEPPLRPLEPLLGLVRLLVGLVTLLVAPALAPSGPAELDPAEVTAGWASPAVAGVRPAAAGALPVPEPATSEAVGPAAVGLLDAADVTGLVAPGGAVAPAAPLVAAAGAAAPSDIWITGTGPVEKVLEPVAETLSTPSTLYISR